MIAEGDQVALARAVERFPHFLAPAGLRGEVVIAGPDLISVRMHDPLPGAEAWENEIEWGEGRIEEAAGDLQVLSSTSCSGRTDVPRQPSRWDLTDWRAKYDRCPDCGGPPDDPRQMPEEGEMVGDLCTTHPIHDAHIEAGRPRQAEPGR